MNVSSGVFSSKTLLSVWQLSFLDKWYLNKAETNEQMICENSFAFIAPKRGQREEVCNCEINQHTAFISIVEFVQTCPGPLGPRMLDCSLVSLLLQPLTHPEGLSCDLAVVLFGDKCFIVRLRDFVTKMNSVNIMEGKCVKCCYSQTPIKRPPSGKWTMAT